MQEHQHNILAQGFHQGFKLALQHAEHEPRNVKQALQELLAGVEEEQAQQASDLRVLPRLLCQHVCSCGTMSWCWHGLYASHM